MEPKGSTKFREFIYFGGRKIRPIIHSAAFVLLLLYSFQPRRLESFPPLKERLMALSLFVYFSPPKLVILFISRSNLFKVKKVFLVSAKANIKN